MDAEDVVQEAYFRLAALDGHNQVAQPVGYIYRIVRNLAVDLIRRFSREKLWSRGCASGERA
jgi:RNA polymerase sigma-70 factor (ECF subfamily)